ncbi:jg27118 [Pararge aegeria aegeria]|uniref:Jg27118 protein n=1 Tax=Pararge aegeria aegeria TaxID=348720 RepID=A0A8S4QLD4_9NEOP|nr:jg27118 [Pararge aegeria aegeria]
MIKKRSRVLPMEVTHHSGCIRKRQCIVVNQDHSAKSERLMRNYMKNQYQHSSASCKAEVEMGRAHRSENRWTLGFQGIGVATPNEVNRRHQTNRWEPLETSGLIRRLRIIEWAMERAMLGVSLCVDQK